MSVEKRPAPNGDGDDDLARELEALLGNPGELISELNRVLEGLELPPQDVSGLTAELDQLIADMHSDAAGLLDQLNRERVDLLERLGEGGDLEVHSEPFPLDLVSTAPAVTEHILSPFPAGSRDSSPTDALGATESERPAFESAIPEGAVQPPDPNLLAADAAIWMQARVEAEGILYQTTAVNYIRNHIGARFVYRNRQGNFAIAKEVLREFRRRTARTVVWQWREHYWRLRRSEDPAGRRIGP